MIEFKLFQIIFFCSREICTLKGRGGKTTKNSVHHLFADFSFGKRARLIWTLSLLLLNSHNNLILKQSVSKVADQCLVKYVATQVGSKRTSIGHWPLGVGHWQLPGTGNYWQLLNFPHVVTAPLGGSTLPNHAGAQTHGWGSSPTVLNMVKPPMEGSVPSAPPQAGEESTRWGGDPTTSSSVSLDETSWKQHNQGSLLKNQLSFAMLKIVM